MLTKLQAKTKATLAPFTVKRELPWVLIRQVTSKSLGDGKALSALEAAVWPDASVYE